jgi:hypothetical protein
MSTPAPVYIIDANVLIQAHRLYYAFPICPGFWDCLLRGHQAGRIVSVDKVRDEIDPGDALFQWVQSSTPPSFFASTQDSAVAGNFGALVGWVQSQSQFMQAGKDEFAQVADGWLVAHAQAHPNHVVVTMEEHAPQARKKVPLPNVCLQFAVPYTDTFTMLRDLGARFLLEP